MQGSTTYRGQQHKNKQRSVPIIEDGKEVLNYRLCNFTINT